MPDIEDRDELLRRHNREWQALRTVVHAIYLKQMNDWRAQGWDDAALKQWTISFNMAIERDYEAYIKEGY